MRVVDGVRLIPHLDCDGVTRSMKEGRWGSTVSSEKGTELEFDR